MIFNEAELQPISATEFFDIIEDLDLWRVGNHLRISHNETEDNIRYTLTEFCHVGNMVVLAKTLRASKYYPSTVSYWKPVV